MQTQFTNKQILFLTGAGLVVGLIALVLTGVLPGKRVQETQIAELEIWGIDSEAVWKDVIKGFESTYPGVDVSYRKFSHSSYEDSLINGLAAGNGPDILFFDNNWLLQHRDKIVPLPTTKMGLTTLNTLFPQTIEKDFVIDGRIYALPLYIDTLFLAYNRNHFDQAGIVAPPTTWAELEENIKDLKITNEKGLERAAFAIGGSSASVKNAPDILKLILMQAGAPMVNSKLSQADIYSGDRVDVFSGYTAYADPKSSTYTWDNDTRDNLDAFAKGDVSGVFVYSRQLEEIRSKNSLLDIGIGSMPQATSQAINYPDYYGLAVSNKSKDPSIAWDFIIYATTDKQSASYYQSAMDLPPALRFLIGELKNESGRIGILARQALTAKSWLQPNQKAFDGYFDQAIESVLDETLKARDALERLQKQTTELYR
ncbi:MAG: hypothetical protein COT89_01955 [Candidatus Colwellbacteria bacterium CG10_big_fil_rev_8_21_14_0_10_42_22]|uniref:ABC transporter substrate-binding protein n=1 Tax=Candidatus Colwellbacteria bacterium CG10_big_fil_rev_8_21_14_0_10_42_22 TaxID=1974540 RepID=A0A2H0VG06_9BACT|nr:MAG: hypothetical protein COT89_01955 [Candidatus Colwellbacteria bacterium CG10_big_fil_rev_8_21_14_0_10_42_22]